MFPVDRSFETIAILSIWFIVIGIGDVSPTEIDTCFYSKMYLIHFVNGYVIVLYTYIRFHCACRIRVCGMHCRQNFWNHLSTLYIYRDLYCFECQLSAHFENKQKWKSKAQINFCIWKQFTWFVWQWLHARKNTQMIKYIYI